MFKLGFSSQSEGMELWDVEGLAELEDEVDLVNDSEEAGDVGPLLSASPLRLEPNTRWLRG